ncbi:bile acid:sodium symporter family protein [Embleya hyalina]|uniref:Bile acid:sodium symporter n=1 Tax=Embleya hyalina TaxID=516124 RepID=A0A401YF47_9ACTN|nr:bile acid:sodium symporter family protein [Embleya hyalina]GCD93188.1 bile acid:sodium symporter [Embleya hyalina]
MQDDTPGHRTRLLGTMRRLPIDPYIAALLGTVALAAVLPAQGRAASTFGVGADVAIGLLFFLYGARLSTGEAVAGLRHWRLHLTIVCCTFVVFPAFGLAASGLVPQVLTRDLYIGLLFLCVVPSTVQSSIALTSVARGNVPAAICAGTYSSLLGMLATPLLAAWLIGSRVDVSASGLLSIGTQLLAPFLAGQLLRPRLGAFVTRHKTWLGLVDRGSILLVVYCAFSAGMVQGVWQQVTPARLAALVVVTAALLGATLGLTATSSRRLGFTVEDRITIVFGGATKSLAAGLPMAAVLFGAHAGTTILPLMLYHQLQLIVCSVLSGRWARRPDNARDFAHVPAPPAPCATEPTTVPAGNDDRPRTGDLANEHP